MRRAQHRRTSSRATSTSTISPGKRAAVKKTVTPPSLSKRLAHRVESHHRVHAAAVPGAQVLVQRQRQHADIAWPAMPFFSAAWNMGSDGGLLHADTLPRASPPGARMPGRAMMASAPAEMFITQMMRSGKPSLYQRQGLRPSVTPARSSLPTRSVHGLRG